MDQGQFGSDTENKLYEEQWEATQAKKILGKAGMALFLMTVASLAIQGGLGELISVINPNILKMEWYVWVASILSITIIGFGVFYLTIRKVPISAIGEKQTISVTQFFLYFVLCTGTGYLFNIIGVIYTTIISLLTGKNILNPVVDIMTNSSILYSIAYVAILAPFVEEMIFRKLLLDRLRRFGDIPAMLLSGVAFGLFHMNLSQFIYATALGILYAYIALKTNQIKYVILLHMANNLLATLVGVYVVKNIVLSLIASMWVIGLIIGAIILISLNIKNIKLSRPQRRLLQVNAYFTSVGWWLFWASCLAIIVVNLVV